MKKKALILTFLTVAASAITGVGFSSFIIAFQGMPDPVDVPLQNQIEVGAVTTSSLNFLTFGGSELEGLSIYHAVFGETYDQSNGTFTNQFTYASGTTAKLKNANFSYGNYINWKPTNFDALQVDWTITFKDALTGVDDITAAYSFTKTFSNGNSYTSDSATPAATLNNQVITISYMVPFVNDANQKIAEPFITNDQAAQAQGPGDVDFNVSLDFCERNDNIINTINIIQTEQPSVAVKLTAIKR